MSERTGIGTNATQTWGDLCRELRRDSLALIQGGIPIYLDEACERKTLALPVSVSAHFGAYPLEKQAGFGTLFEHFKEKWVSKRVDAEGARTWATVPSLADINLLYPTSSHSALVFRIGLHRDLAAWHDDDLGLNTPLSEKEVDINEPSLGYIHAEDSHYAFTLGRFPVQWSPSPDFGLTLSRSVPYHNGAEFALKMQAVTYRFLVSSLNPWLEGTPSGDSASEEYPVGSEEYRQRHYPSDHAASLYHNRVYADRIKTLFAHRLEGSLGPLTLGITEAQVIGGKPPELRDAGPFIFFHNDFKEGYANGALGLDAALRLPAGFALAAEYYIDDVGYAETETEGNSASLHGFMVSVRRSMAMRGWLIGQGIHVIRTDPYLYGYLQPLNTMSSRRVLASNRQLPGDSLYVDKYVIDFPIGYLRGGDALDFWYRADAWRGRNLHFALAAAWLNKGETDLYTPYETYYSAQHSSPSGIATREFRVRIEGEYRLKHGLTAGAGGAWQSISDQGHVQGRDMERIQASAFLAWNMPE